MSYTLTFIKIIQWLEGLISKQIAIISQVQVPINYFLIILISFLELCLSHYVTGLSQFYDKNR